MITVISPAKRLDFDSQTPSRRQSRAAFPLQSERLVDHLRRFSPGCVAENDEDQRPAGRAQPLALPDLGKADEKTRRQTRYLCFQRRCLYGTGCWEYG